MLTDAHCHPHDLAACFPAAEEERRRLGVICASSACSMEEFEYCEKLPGVAPCFGVHPQQLSIITHAKTQRRKADSGFSDECFASPRLGVINIENILSIMESLATEGRLAAVGEAGFDLFNAEFKETEKAQEGVFAAQLEIALRHDLPLVIHARRAMHKIFAHAAGLKKCKALVFHSWPGTTGEGEALLRRGLNAYFSFGTALLLNHRQAMRCCALLPSDRLLAETDAPYQGLRGKAFSRYADLADIIRAMETLRGQASMEGVVEGNFRAVFSGSLLT